MLGLHLALDRRFLPTRVPLKPTGSHRVRAYHHIPLQGKLRFRVVVCFMTQFRLRTDCARGIVCKNAVAQDGARSATGYAPRLGRRKGEARRVAAGWNQ